MEEKTSTLRKLPNPTLDNFIYLLTKFFFSCMTCCELYYFTAYLTDTAMFSVALVGLITTVTTVVDTLFSLVNGVVLQKLGDAMPWGTYRSWLLVGPPLTLVSFIFCFVRVSDNDMVAAAVIIAAFIVSHIIWSLAESALITMSVVWTDDTNERAQLSISLGRGSLSFSLVFGLIAAPIMGVFNSFSGGTLGYFGLALICGILNCVAYWVLFAVTKGVEDDKATKKRKAERAARAAAASNRTASVGQMYKIVFTNKNIILMIICVTLNYASMFLGSALMFYYFTYCLDSIGMMGIFMTIRSVFTFLGGFFTPILLKLCKGNKKTAYVISYLIACVGYLVPFLTRPGFMGYAIMTCAFSLINGGGNMLQTAMYGDCAVECEYKSGKDVRGMVMSFMSLPIKLGVILKSVLATAALSMIGYVGGMAPSNVTYNGFNMAFLLWPAIIALVCAVLALLFYKLPESRVAEMIAENDRRALEDQKLVEAALAEQEAAAT